MIELYASGGNPKREMNFLVDFIMTIFFLTGQAFSLFRHFWIVTLLSVVGMVLSISIQYIFFEQQRWQARHLVVFSPLIFSFLTLFWGAVFKDRPEAATANWISLFLLAFLLFQLIASIWVVWKMKGFRWFSIFAVVLQLLFGFGCVFVSAMSITGDWM